MKMYANQVKKALNGVSEERRLGCVEDLRSEFVPPSERGARKHTLQVCPSCGRLDWTMSGPADMERFLLDYQNTTGRNELQYCDDCNDAARRNPELLMLVQRMIAQAMHLEKKKEADND